MNFKNILGKVCLAFLFEDKCGATLLSTATLHIQVLLTLHPASTSCLLPVTGTLGSIPLAVGDERTGQMSSQRGRAGHELVPGDS